MTSIINKLLGRDDESHSQSTSQSSQSSTANNRAHGNTDAGAAHGTETRTVQHEGVNIKSTISSDAQSTVSMENQQKLKDLVTKLGSTHTQIDDYAKKQTAKINEEIQREIDQVVARTSREQEELLRRANEHTAQIDAEYRARLQKMVEEVDATKAKRIAEIEKQLNDQQNGILQLARTEIDQLNQKAAGMKIDVLQQAQVKAAADASNITAQAASLGQTSTVHQSKGTTTIKTEVTAATTTKATDTATAGARQAHTVGGAGVTATGYHETNASTGGAKTSHSSDTKTVETSHHQSNDGSRK